MVKIRLLNITFKRTLPVLLCIVLNSKQNDLGFGVFNFILFINANLVSFAVLKVSLTFLIFAKKYKNRDVPILKICLVKLNVT